MLYTIVNFTTQCDENRHTDIANFATLLHTKKLIHCVAILTILYTNYYPPHGEFKLICIGKFARRTWVNFTQQYGKSRQTCQQNKFYYDVWQLLLYYYREFPSKILSVPNWVAYVVVSNNLQCSSTQVDTLLMNLNSKVILYIYIYIYIYIS